MSFRIAMSSYGHTDPGAPDRPRNAMLLVNWGLWQGVQRAAERLGAEAVDLSPPLGPRGIRRDLHADTSGFEPADAMLFQGGVSLHAVAYDSKTFKILDTQDAQAEYLLRERYWFYLLGPYRSIRRLTPPPEEDTPQAPDSPSSGSKEP